MTLDRDELLRHYRTMHADLMDAVAGLSDDEMAEPSLDGWSVANHLVHVSLWDEIRADEIERISAGFESAWRMESEDEPFNLVTERLRRGLSPAQARWEIEHTHQALLAALERATPEGLNPEKYGEAGLFSTHKAEHTGWIRRWRESR